MVSLILFALLWGGLHYGMAHCIIKLKHEFGDPWPTLLLICATIMLGMMLYMDWILGKLVYDIYTFNQIWGSNA